MTESLIILIFMTLIVSLMTLSGYLFTRKNILSKYHFNRKKERINWKKVSKCYIYIQIFFLCCKLLGNYKLNWIVVFGLPFMIISYLLVCYFFLNQINDIDLESESDFETYKKQHERDNKINKILK